MKTKNLLLLTKDEWELFRESVSDVKKLPQESALHFQSKPKFKQIASLRLLQEQINASYYFSDKYHPLLEKEGPTRYAKLGSNLFKLRKLRRGDYSPDVFLDLHGLTQRQAKKELGALIAICKRECIYCACVMHGHGKHILKKQIPLWFAKHPDILAFHQAPKEWGGSAAILFLIKSAK